MERDVTFASPSASWADGTRPRLTPSSSPIADFGMDIQQALEAGRFTKPTFDGCDVELESLIPPPPATSSPARGHRITTHGPRTSTFGYGQAVMSARSTQHGASDPRHDGAAIPEHPVAAGRPGSHNRAITLPP
jgi:hypothetical protein